MLTRDDLENMVWAEDRADAERKAQLLDAVVIGETDIQTICMDCFGPLICMRCHHEKYTEGH